MPAEAVRGAQDPPTKKATTASLNGEGRSLWFPFAAGRVGKAIGGVAGRKGTGAAAQERRMGLAQEDGGVKYERG